MLTKAEQEALEEKSLAAYAMKSRHTRGRDYPIASDNIRTDFQRDRDRIIHCAAFRKLEYKTQVYFIHEGDYYRTRLTHTLEVAQIGRSLARNLSLNVDLAEAIALAHDLGHTPFGHSGEVALRRLMADHGGFEHNAQGLRVVEKLERRYPEFPGLNLIWEVREGMIKHTTSYDRPSPDRFDPHLAPPLEAQVVEIADEIAFNSHDVDDALAMGLIEENDLRQVGWLWQIWERAHRSCSDRRETDRVKYRAIGQLIEIQMLDVLEATEAGIARLGIRSVEDVRNARQRIVAFSPQMAGENVILRDFLLRHVYNHPRVVRMVAKAEDFIERLFKSYRNRPGQMPLECQAWIETEGLERVIADYISGMTDRFLMDEYVRAFEPEPFLR